MKQNTLILIHIIWLVFIINVNNVFGLDRVAGQDNLDYEDISDNVMALSDGIPHGYMVIDGDIIVPEDFFTPKAAYQTNLWTNNEVPYEFDESVTRVVITENQIRMQDAMQEWENISDVQFIQCPGNSCAGNYLHIQHSDERNSSSVGMIEEGQQVVNIHDWWDRFIIVHELGHALGYWHEHQRSDQSEFVQMYPNNRDPSECDSGCFDSNFDPDAPNNYGPYDFDSVMHYDECAFALNPCPCDNPSDCQTIEVLMSCNTTTETCTNAASAGRACENDADCDPILVGECNMTTNICVEGTVGQEDCITDGECNINIGQTTHLSEFDALTMSLLYSEPNWRFVDKSYSGTQSGTFFEPFWTLYAGITYVPAGGTIIIQPGSYNVAGTGVYTKAMTLKAPLGGVVIGN